MHSYFQISRHKTDYMAPANVALPEPLWGFLQSYLTLLKSLPGYNDKAFRRESVFVGCRSMDTPELKPPSVSGINRALNSLWQLVHRRQPISATLLRKSVVTAVRSQEPRSREVLARHMSHQATTADR